MNSGYIKEEEVLKVNRKTSGIHHISAIVGHPQENADFYAGVLGLRMVKQTVNFDDPGTYHLYFGNKEGKPGTIITFFPWANALRGVIGDGQVGVTSYAIPKDALEFWKDRLAKFKISYTIEKRFSEESIRFHDPHGLVLEMVERDEGEPNTWSFAGITPDVAVKGFAGATLYSSQPEQTAHLLEKVMGIERMGEEGEMIRFKSSAEIGNVIDLKKTTGKRGKMGVGTVHHIAWRAEDNQAQLEWQEYVRSNGYGVTPVKDRKYFNAIYFREHGEILFEIATDPPGFAHDESSGKMGEKLMLPEQYETMRSRIERKLIPIKVRELE